MPRWPFDFAPRIKTKFKKLIGEKKKKNLTGVSCFFHREFKQKIPEQLPISFQLPIMLKKRRDSVKRVLAFQPHVFVLLFR